MQKYHIRFLEIGKDISDTVESAMWAGGYAFYFIAGQYINQRYFDGQLDDLTSQTEVFSRESAFFLTNLAFMLGAGLETLKTGYHTLKIPVKAITGKYIKKEKNKK
jgi:hypothetical protein